MAEVNEELHRLEKLIEKSLEITTKNTEAINEITMAQKISTLNIQKLEEAVKSVISDSPDIAIMQSKVETISKVLWALAAATLGIIVTLIKHTLIE